MIEATLARCKDVRDGENLDPPWWSSCKFRFKKWRGLPLQLHPITPPNKPDQALFFTSSGKTQLTAALGTLH